MNAPAPHERSWRPALHIALTYAAVGGLWILLSGKVLDTFVQEPSRIVALEIVKGLLFIAVTAALVYVLVARHTARLKDSEQRQRQIAERFRAMFAQSPVGVALYGPDGRLLDANRACLAIFGVGDLKAALGMCFLNDPNLPADAAAELQAGRPARFERRYDFAAVRAAGLYPTTRADKADLEVLFTPLHGDSPAHVAGYLLQVQDVTARRSLESQLQHAHKMEAIGQLAGGVAHDFNNILTALFGHVDLLRDDLEGTPDPAALRHGLDEIERAGERAARLTRQLLTFSRRQAVRLEHLDLGRLVSDLERLLRRLLPESIDLILDAPAGLPPVRADAGQLEQVVLNLVLNARDAMPEGGKLILQVAARELDADYVASCPEARPGPHIVLVVRDTGVGMDAAVQGRMFEPFFTTKPVGRGTGLGLATVHGIVKQFGGHITTVSAPGQGTTFHVLFPAEPAAAVTAPLPASPVAPGGRETVLVCEDDETVRGLAARTLESHGYLVLAAARPEEALARAAEHAGPIDLLVADIVMAGMNGVQLAHQLRAQRAEVRVLYISGYPTSVLARQGVLEPGIELLEKPFGPGALLRRVRALLDVPA